MLWPLRLMARSRAFFAVSAFSLKWNCFVSSLLNFRCYSNLLSFSGCKDKNKIVNINMLSLFSAIPKIKTSRIDS